MEIPGGTGTDGIINLYHMLPAMLLPDNDGIRVVIVVPIVQRQKTVNVYKVVNMHVTLPDVDLVAHFVVESYYIAVTKDRQLLICSHNCK